MSLYRQIKPLTEGPVRKGGINPDPGKDMERPEPPAAMKNQTGMGSRPIQELKEEIARPRRERRKDEKLVLISVRIHEDDLAYFKKLGAGYQSAIRAALREYVDRKTEGI
jgi:uncharacterized protein (DUF4415 family)